MFPINFPPLILIPDPSGGERNRWREEGREGEKKEKELREKEKLLSLPPGRPLETFNNKIFFVS